MGGGRDRLDQVHLHRRVEGGLAVGDPLQGLLDLGGAGVLGQVAEAAA